MLDFLDKKCKWPTDSGASVPGGCQDLTCPICENYGQVVTCECYLKMKLSLFTLFRLLIFPEFLFSLSACVDTIKFAWWFSSIHHRPELDDATYLLAHISYGLLKPCHSIWVLASSCSSSFLWNWNVINSMCVVCPMNCSLLCDNETTVSVVLPSSVWWYSPSSPVRTCPK